MDYPYNSPLILTDDIFTLFGGETGTSSVAQRQASYLAAEILATQELGTYLAPTVVTGTFPWPYLGKPLVLPHHHIRSVDSVIPYAPNCDNTCNLLDGTACSYQQDDGMYGYLLLRDTTYLYNVCCTRSIDSAPLEVQVVYETGYASGTSYSPNILLGLTKVAQKIMNEILDPGANEGGAGDPGVVSFTSLGHSEVRKTLLNTALGNSAVMNFVHLLFKPYKPKRCYKLGW